MMLHLKPAVSYFQMIRRVELPTAAFADKGLAADFVNLEMCYCSDSIC